MDVVAAGPLLLNPRLDPKPWGGRGLARFGFDLPAEAQIGEAVVTASEAVVADGPLAGATMGDLVAADPIRMLGREGMAATGGRSLFPLLVKILDAAQTLSLQVHPDDAAAPAGSLGKTEAWHVLATSPGARLVAGLTRGTTAEAFAEGCRNGRGGLHARWLAARKGATFLIPAGAVHALGAGCLVYEVQQPSDVTYRLDDWGRVDASGCPRELHVEQALSVVAVHERPSASLPSRLPSAVGRRRLLTACRYFALERIDLNAGEGLAFVAPDSPQVFTCLRGEIVAATANGEQRLPPGATAVVAAAGGPCFLVAASAGAVLRTWIPAAGLAVM
jgi:mannose-6-phosphate isomerase